MTVLIFYCINCNRRHAVLIFYCIDCNRRHATIVSVEQVSNKHLTFSHMMALQDFHHSPCPTDIVPQDGSSFHKVHDKQAIVCKKHESSPADVDTVEYSKVPR